MKKIIKKELHSLKKIPLCNFLPVLKKLLCLVQSTRLSAVVHSNVKLIGHLGHSLNWPVQTNLSYTDVYNRFRHIPRLLSKDIMGAFFSPPTLFFLMATWQSKAEQIKVLSTLNYKSSSWDELSIAGCCCTMEKEDPPRREGSERNASYSRYH